MRIKSYLILHAKSNEKSMIKRNLSSEDKPWLKQKILSKQKYSKNSAKFKPECIELV